MWLKTALLVSIFLGFNPVIGKGENAMKLTSPDFQHNGNIPAKFTCSGEDVSPNLEISGIPASAKSLALIVDDPDAPIGDWVHWVVFNIPPETGSIKENTIPGVQVRNDFRREKWGGPCPPSGTHRYFFKLFALDTLLDSKPALTKKELLKAMEGHILDKAELVGLFKRF